MRYQYRPRFCCHSGLLLSASLLLFTIPALSQTPVPAIAPTPPPPASSLRRWFELQTAQLRIRYHFRETSAGITATDAIQHKEAFQGRFKFDAEGHYSLTALVATGSRFTGGWNNFTHGTGHFGTNLYLKHLFFTAQPVKGVEYSIGGFDMLRGQATEITTWNNDAFMTGQRLTLRHPQEMFFDEVAVTYGFLGDFNTPNLNKRYHRLKKFNYHQFLVSKHLGKRAAVSADYTFVSGVESLRQAVKVRTPELRWLDAITFETYQRVDVNPDWGFALHGEKTLRKRLTLGGGYTQIDPLLPALNADRFFQGKHVFTNNSLALTPELNLFVFLTRKVATSNPVPVKTRFEIGLTVNLLKTLQRAGWFRS